MNKHCRICNQEKRLTEFFRNTRKLDGYDNKCKSCDLTQREIRKKKGKKFHYVTGKTTEERFWAKVQKTDNCWNWLASRGTYGHGVFGFDGKSTAAHRYSYQLHKGIIPEGLLVCHTCDTPGCVNPEHLFLGTYKENMEDMSRKGRGFQQRQTHCKRGHEFDEKLTSQGLRHCSTCKAIRYAEKKKTKKILV